MPYLLDTNVWVDYLNSRFPSVLHRIQQASSEDLCLSSVVLAELRYGADRSMHRERNHTRLDVLAREIPCRDFDPAAAAHFGRLRTQLESQGLPIGPYDMLIAAHALSLGYALVTDNVREFSRIEGLTVENWRS